MSTDDLISITEAARRLGVNRITLHRWRQANKIIVLRLGKTVCVPVAEVERLELEREALKA